MPPWSLDPEAWSWNQRLAVLAQEAFSHFRPIVLPIPAKGQRLKPGPDPESDRRRLTSEAEAITIRISGELDQHPAQSGFDGIREGGRISCDDNPGVNAEPRNAEDDGEEGQPDLCGGGTEHEVRSEGDAVQPQHAVSPLENRSLPGRAAQLNE